MQIATEPVACPYCRTDSADAWATENGFTAVKCRGCGLVYVNPRPAASVIAAGVETGEHKEIEGGHNVVGRRSGRKVRAYRRVFESMFGDVWARNSPIKWLDIGAGFGEVVEAVQSLAPAGSQVEGIEPMRPKAEYARAQGLRVRTGYLDEIKETYQFVSLIHVFSHLPDFRSFLTGVRAVLDPHGEFFLETGNIGDLSSPHEVPAQLDLPDHLVFAGERHIKGYLEEAGFTIVQLNRIRRDTVINLAKQTVHKLRGKQVSLAIPYTSRYRSLRIRARLNSR